MPESEAFIAPSSREPAAHPAASRKSVSRSHWKILVLPVLLLLCVTLPHLNQGDFRRDASKYGAVGLYMWSEGHLLTPMLDPTTPYFNKPPLAFWIHGLSLKLFGTNVAAGRVPSILAALGVVCLSVLTVRKLSSKTEAVVSGMILALSYEFFRRTREISLDFWQLLFVMLGVYFFVCGMQENRTGKVLLAGVPLGLALMCKPFVAFGVMPVFIVWAFLTGRIRLVPFVIFGTLPIAALVALPWHWYMYNHFGDAFIRQYFFHEVAERVSGLRGSAPAYYYVKQLFSTYWPWMALLLFALYRRFFVSAAQRRKNRDLVLLSSCWLVCVGLLISLFPDKSPNYALPLYPMLSWIVAWGICRLPWQRLRVWWRSDFRGLAPATIILLLILSLAPIEFQKPPDKDWQTLFTWLRKNQISVTQLGRGNLTPPEVCYVYLKTGLWLPPIPGEPENAIGQFTLVHLESGDSEPAQVAQRFGKLAVIRSTGVNKPLP